MATPFDALNMAMQQGTNLLVNGIKSVNNFGIQAVRSLNTIINPANLTNPANLPNTIFTEVNRVVQTPLQQMQQGVRGVGQVAQSTLKLPAALAIPAIKPFRGLAGIAEDTSFFGEAASDQGMGSGRGLATNPDDTSMF